MFVSANPGLRQVKETIAAAAASAEAFGISSTLERYKAETGVDEAGARRHRRELVRFVMMVARAGGRGYGMYGAVDAGHWTAMAGEIGR